MGRDGSLGVTSIADGLGLVGSAVCIVHCLAVPALLVAGGALPVPFLSDELFHEAILWAILPAALIAFGLGCWQHKDRWVLILGSFGLVGLSLSIAPLHDLLGESGERLVTVAAATALMAAHVRNFKLCRSGRCDHHHGT